MKNMLAAVLALVLVVTPMAVFAEEGVTFEIGAALETGTKTYEVCGLEYTVYTFDPSEVGKYTFTSSNSLIGIVSYNGMWVTVEPSATTITESSVVWDCKAVGQSIWLAALSKEGGVNISVEKEYIEIITYETYHYENKVKPTAFTFDGDESKLDYVDIEDGNKDKAVLGKDGYYHLNDANGPRLFVSLNDSMMSFYNMREPGQLIALARNEDNSVKYKTDYNSAFDEYWECAAAVTLDGEALSIYPLTDDLIVMIKNVAGHHGWFKEEGWLSDVDPEDGWMFPCVYVVGEAFENNEIEGGGKTDDDFKDEIIDEGGSGGVTEDSPTSSPSTSTNNTNTPGGAGNNGTAHQTGDNSAVLFAVIAAVVVAGACVVLFIRKKRNTVSF